MKKHIVFLALAAIVLGFSSCDFKIPTTIEITGSPKLTLTGSYNTGPMLSEMVSGLFDGYDNDGRVKIFDCVNESIYTMLVYIDLLTLNFYFSDADNIIAALDVLRDQGLPEELSLSNTLFSGVTFPSFEFPDVNDEDALEMPSLDLGDITGDLRFDGLKARLYIYGHPVLHLMTITLDANTSKDLNQTQEPVVFKTLIESDSKEYPGDGLPEFGYDMTSMITEDGLENFTISFAVDPNKKITRDMIVNQDIRVVLAVWLPLKMVASKPGSYTLFDFGKVEEGETPDDLLGRDGPGSSLQFDDVKLDIDKIKLTLTMSSSPFKGSEIKITNGELGKPGYLTFDAIEFKNNNTVVVDFKKADMDKILNSYPFAPKIDLAYKADAVISIPRVLNLTRLDLETKAKVTLPLEFGE